MNPWDCFGLSEQGSDLESNDDFVVTDPKLGVFLVADGMGGRLGGAHASRLAAQVFLESLRSLEPFQRLEHGRLLEAVARANQEIHSAGEHDPLVAGLGTTFSAAVMQEARGKLVHIGDSRIYLFHEGRLEQQTRDHTLVAELVARKHLSPEGAKRYPLRNVLSRALGTEETVEADVADLTLHSGEWLVLATDGLTKALDLAELARLVSRFAGETAEILCRNLISAAVQEHPDDNVTVAVVRRAA